MGGSKQTYKVQTDKKTDREFETMTTKQNPIDTQTAQRVPHFLCSFTKNKIWAVQNKHIGCRPIKKHIENLKH